MKKIFLKILSCCLVTMFCMGLSLPAAAVADSESKVLRVAYPIQSGLTMLDENGGHYGYTHEYLQEIAKYTGWTYEFVEIAGNSDQQLLTALSMLQNGEVDLLGSLNYDDALTGLFTYPGYCYGTNYMGLFVPYDSSLSETTLYTADNVRVAVFQKDGEKNDKLEQFALMNNLPIEQVLVDSPLEMQSAVATGRADALLSTDLSVEVHPGMNVIAHFSPTPFYFATTKGNVDIVRQLDYALSTIMQVTPNFEGELTNRYFPKYASQFYLTADEQQFISNAPVQRVLVYENKPPFYHTDPDTGEALGILPELFGYISKTTGLQFSFHTVSTYDEYIAWIKDGRADISADRLLLNQNSIDTKTISTLPWHALPVQTVLRSESKAPGAGKGAILHSLKDAFPDADSFLYFDTAEQCMQAVQEGRVDFAHVDGYSAQYLLNSSRYEDLKLVSGQNIPVQQACFGVVDTSNFYLLSLLNKSISFLPQNALEEVVYKNTYRQQAFPFSSWLKEHTVAISITVMVLTILLLATYIHLKNKRQRQIAFENKRYHTISTLSNEFFYEYDRDKDRLILPEKCAHYFSCATVIERFAETLETLGKDDSHGIWQLGTLIVDGVEGTHELSCQMPDESRQWFQVISATLLDENTHTHAIGKIVDIQSTKTEQIRLEQRAMTDGLTGIYNVTAIRHIVQERLADFDACSPCAFLVMDIDNFKQINDSYGHYTGDAALVQAANLIATAFSGSLAGRLGGDEFIIFAERITLEELRERCHRLLMLAPQAPSGSASVPFTLSIGVAVAQQPKTYDELYQEADNALYQIKSGLKNGYAIFEKESAPHN